MENFSTTFVTTQSALNAYNAIANFRDWWSEDIEGNTNIPGETFFYRYKEVHLCKLQLIEAVPGKKLEYKVLDNYFSFTKDKTEWKNSSLVFMITAEDGKTKVSFTHQGLTEADECYQVCNEAWSNFIHNSLYPFIEKGKGKPNPKEGEGFNAAIVEKWKLKTI
ncbi:MAG TPA: SRPBCC domain-containing protein [Ferruginibacter sp.]|nr:SRPBCC domain-containing protein [Ferruginibacter sp.]HMP20350.1 SRPBCC domain-containing protein [Ferruginibacter sp.]